jgi:hypothetical protein
MLGRFALYTMWCRASLPPPPLRVAEPSSPCAHSLRSFRLPPELQGVAGRIPRQAGRLKPLGNLSWILLPAKYLRPLTFSSNFFPFLRNLILNLIFSLSSASTLPFVLPSSFVKKCFQHFTAFFFKNTSVNFYFVI